MSSRPAWSVRRAAAVLPALLVAGAALLGLPSAGAQVTAVEAGSTAVAPAAVPAPAAAPAAPAALSAVPQPRVAVPQQLATAVRPDTGLACQQLQALSLCTHGDDSALGRASQAAGSEGGSRLPTTSTRIGCYGDGTSGPRVVATYLRATGSADRYDQYVARFRGWAGATEKTFDDSAHQTGGARHLRFRTTAGTSCTLDILRVTVAPQALSSLTSTVHALQQKGLDQPGTKYLLWTESDVYCGIASMYDDNTPGAGNLNNGQMPTYARVDRSCWGYAEPHEVMHMLGGVSPNAPHGTAGFHCNDGADVMCYDDGTKNATQTTACGSDHARLFDCHGDDYYAMAPAQGSWLATHWNVAGSSFLSPAWSEPPPASPSPTPTPTPSAQPQPSAQPTPAAPLSLPLPVSLPVSLPRLP